MSLRTSFLRVLICLDHEGGDLAVMVLSDTLDEFFNTWCQLGCPGPEWPTIVGFMDPEALRVSLATRRSSACWERCLAVAQLGGETADVDMAADGCRPPQPFELAARGRPFLATSSHS